MASESTTLTRPKTDCRSSKMNDCSVPVVVRSSFARPGSAHTATSWPSHELTARLSGSIDHAATAAVYSRYRSTTGRQTAGTTRAIADCRRSRDVVRQLGVAATLTVRRCRTGRVWCPRDEKRPDRSIPLKRTSRSPLRLTLLSNYQHRGRMFRRIISRRRSTF